MSATIKLFAPAIFVPDLRSAIRQYTEILGFRLPKSGPYAMPIALDEGGDHKMDFAFLEKNGRYLELIEPKGGARLELFKRRGPGPYLLDFETDDIEAAFAAIAAKGVPVFDPVGRPIQAGRVHKGQVGEKCFFFYLEGTYIEVSQAPAETSP